MPSTPDTTHVRRCLRFFAGVLAIPFVAGCLSVWAFAYLLLGLLFIAVSYLILLVFGGVLFGVDGFRATTDREGGVERVCVALIAGADGHGCAVELACIFRRCGCRDDDAGACQP